VRIAWVLSIEPKRTARSFGGFRAHIWALFNVAIDAWDVKPGLPKGLFPIEPHLERLMRKQFVYG
jgi:hypothetical protein